MSANWTNYKVVCAGLTREMADVLSWTSALCFKVEQHLKKGWKPGEPLVKLYTGEIPEGRQRKSVLITEDSYRFVCRYCGQICSEDCIQRQIQKRIDEGLAETKKKFAYEISTT